MRRRLLAVVALLVGLHTQTHGMVGWNKKKPEEVVSHDTWDSFILYGSLSSLQAMMIHEIHVKAHREESAIGGMLSPGDTPYKFKLEPDRLKKTLTPKHPFLVIQRVMSIGSSEVATQVKINTTRCNLTHKSSTSRLKILCGSFVYEMYDVHSVGLDVTQALDNK